LLTLPVTADIKFGVGYRAAAINIR